MAARRDTQSWRFRWQFTCGPPWDFPLTTGRPLLVLPTGALRQDRD